MFVSANNKFWFAEQGLAEVVKELLEHGADVEAQYPHGPSPLIEASKNGHTDSEAQCIECIKACLLEKNIPNDLWPLIGELGRWEVAPASRVWRVPSVFARRLITYPFCLGVGEMAGALLASGGRVSLPSYLRCVNWGHVAFGSFWVFGISLHLYVIYAAMNGDLDLSNWDSDDTWGRIATSI